MALWFVNMRWKQVFVFQRLHQKFEFVAVAVVTVEAPDGLEIRRFSSGLGTGVTLIGRVVNQFHFFDGLDVANMV